MTTGKRHPDDPLMEDEGLAEELGATPGKAEGDEDPAFAGEVGPGPTPGSAEGEPFDDEESPLRT